MRKYVVLIMMIFGCQGNDISNSSKIFIDLDDTESAYFSDFFSKIEYVLIDIPETVPFVKPWKLVFTPNHILVNDREMSNLLIFDKNGVFQNIIRSNGRGPKEFSFINDFQVHENNILILDGSLKKILHFDMDGNFLHEDFIDFQPRIFTSHQKAGLYYFGNSPEIEDFIIVKKEGSKTEGVKALNPYLEGINYGSILGFQKGHNKNIEYLKLDPSYEIIFFDNEKQISSSIEFDFGKYNFPIEKRKSITFSPERFDFLSNGQIVEMIFSFLSLKEKYWMTVNQSGLNAKFAILNSKFHPDKIIDNFINDLDGLKTDFSPFTVEGDNIVTLKSSLDFFNDYNDSFQNGNTGTQESEVSNLHDFVKSNSDKLKLDNYVVVKYEIL